MGIGTLIIFIATILVAAVAAGVLISTSGILQQRALITGQEARKKITNSVEIISILAHGNRTDESMNNFEVLARLDAGSDPLQMKSFDMSWIGPSYDAAASIQHGFINTLPDLGGFDVAVGSVTNTTWTYIMDLDDDNVMERVRLMVTNYSEFLIVNFSDSDVGYFMYNLTVDLDNASGTPVDLDFEDIPIIGFDEQHYGYINIMGNTSVTNQIPDGNATFNITAFPDECSFELLDPENHFCYIVMHGDEDLVLDDGEVLKILWKLKPAHRMFIGEEFRFIFSSEKGRLRQAQARTPDVITSLKVPLWPVG